MEFYGKDAGLRKTLDGIQRRLRSASAMFARVGGGMLAGGLAGLAPMAAAVSKLGELSKLKDAASALNMTAEGASGLFGVLAAQGGDFKEDLEGITQFSARVRDALKGVGGPTGEAARLFEGLSVQAKDLEGLPLDEQFLRVLGAIRQLPQELQATRLGLMGGTDSMKKWLPLLARSEAEIRGQAKALASSKEDLDAAQSATRAYAAATQTLGRVWQQLTVAVAPVVERAANWATAALAPLAEFVSRNRALVVGGVAAAAAVAGLGAAFVGVGAALKVASLAIGGVVAVVGFVATPFGAAVAAVAALAVGFGRLAGVGSTLGATLAGISDALAGGDLALAGRIGMAGLRVEFMSAVANLTTVWNDFKSFFVDGWHDAVYLVGQALSQLTTLVAKQMVNAASAISRNLGGAFEAVGMANPFRFLEENAEGVKRILDEMGRDEELAMHRRFQREQKGREDARRADADAARADLAAAEAERQHLLVTAAFRNLFRGKGAGGALGLPGPGAEIGQAMTSIRGGFLGFGSANAMFGGGAGNVMQKQLDVQKKLLEKTDEEIEVMEEVARQLGRGPRGDMVWGV